MDLAFAGFRSIEAGPSDQYRIKWSAVRFALDVPASAPVLDVPALAAIGSLNLEINRMVTYAAEPGGADLWQTPVQTLALKRGDCEDYAILKYALLTKAGIPARVVIGEIKNILANQPHAWCAAYIDGAWRALDNKFDQIIKVADYINWLPMAAMHDASVVRFGRQFSINDALASKT